MNATCCCKEDELIQFLQGALGVDIVVRLTNNTLTAGYTKHILKPYEQTVFGIRREMLWNMILANLIKKKEELDPNVVKYALLHLIQW